LVLEPTVEALFYGEPGQTYRVEVNDEPVGEATALIDSAGKTTVSLSPGANDVCLRASTLTVGDATQDCVTIIYVDDSPN
ncbi:MAG: hypothetical protein KJO07_15505, partial [Deltaproteobacteria bacterium]|nr:hypothetical protein [Deltaproteobacteria bacterium]